jgi:putative endonuclease
MYYLYIIQHDATKERYIGYTRDIERRLIGHNSGKNKSTHRKEGIWFLIYAEMYRSESDARKRERRLKRHGSGKTELLKRLDASWLDT